MSSEKAFRKRGLSETAPGERMSPACRQALALLDDEDYAAGEDEREVSVGGSAISATSDFSGALEEREERRSTLRAHLQSCAGCRHAALARDPLWAFRLLSTSQEAAAPARPHREESNDWSVEDLKLRVRGAIRAREVEGRSVVASAPALGRLRGAVASSSSSTLRPALLAAGLVLILAAGLLQVGDRDTPVDDEARVRVVSFLETLPVVEAEAWQPEVRGSEDQVSETALADPAAPSREDGAEILAQMSGVGADLVWIVDGSLEI